VSRTTASGGAGPSSSRGVWARQRRRYDLRPSVSREDEPRIRAAHRVFLHEYGEPVFGPGVWQLLVLVQTTGSLHQAAREMGMSYSKAWSAVGRAEDRLAIELLHRHKGGPEGGGSDVTEEGNELIRRFRDFRDEADAELAVLYRKHFGSASFAASWRATPPDSCEAPGPAGETQ